MMICQERNCKITKLIFGFVMLVMYVLCLIFGIKSYLQNGLEFYSIGFRIYFPILQIIISFVLIFSAIFSKKNNAIMYSLALNTPLLYAIFDQILNNYRNEEFIKFIVLYIGFGLYIVSIILLNSTKSYLFKITTILLSLFPTTFVILNKDNILHLLFCGRIGDVHLSIVFSTILSMAPFILIMLSFKRSQNSETLNENKSVNRTIKNVPETIMKYKELLDCGIISEEEFEIKKSQLLNKN